MKDISKSVLGFAPYPQNSYSKFDVFKKASD